MICPCHLDFKLLLEYLKVFISYPVVILILAAWILRAFRPQLKGLIPKITSIGLDGVKINQESIKLVTEALTQANDSSAKEIQTEIGKLKDSSPEEARERLAEVMQLEEEVDRRQSIIDNLNDKLKREEKSKEAALENIKETKKRRIRDACGSLIDAWIKKHNLTSANIYGGPYSELYETCVAQAPALAEEYGLADFYNTIFFLSADRAPRANPMTGELL